MQIRKQLTKKRVENQLTQFRTLIEQTWRSRRNDHSGGLQSSKKKWTYSERLYRERREF